MKLIADSIVKDKFWNIISGGKKVGFLEASLNGYTLKNVNRRERFATLAALRTTHDIEFKDKKISKELPQNELLVYGYPVKVTPFNKVFDIRQHLPLFTKTAKSRSYYCAGHYIIKFEGIGWVTANNPKLITINRYPHRGPFVTPEEAKTLRDEFSKEPE